MLLRETAYCAGIKRGKRYSVAEAIALVEGQPEKAQRRMKTAGKPAGERHAATARLHPTANPSPTPAARSTDVIAPCKHRCYELVFYASAFR